MSDATEDRPLLIVALMHDYAARDLVDSGTLAQLSQEFRLAFISSTQLTMDLSEYGAVMTLYELSPLRRRVYWLAAGLWQMAMKRRFELNHRNTLRQATFGVGPYIERLIDWGARLGMAAPGGWLFRALLRMTTPRLIPPDVRAAAVLAYTPVRSFFIDDVVRDARRRGIPLLALVNNWDNLNTKSFLEIPPNLGVWGEQGFLIARLMYLIPAHRIFVIGSPRFDIYRRVTTTRDEARAVLDLPRDARVIAFCGAGISFEETSLLDELDVAIEDGRLPRDLIVLYKPHPMRFRRIAEKPFDPAAYRHIRLVKLGERQLTELKFYPYLFAAVDALISPFSSMVMEGARFGLPALCVGYNDPAHANHDWGRAMFNLHPYVIRHGDWAVVCERRQDFARACQQLVSLIGNSDVAEWARAAAEMVWRTGRSTTAERLSTVLKSVVAGRPADSSLSQTVVPIKLLDSARDAMALAKD